MHDHTLAVTACVAVREWAERETACGYAYNPGPLMPYISYLVIDARRTDPTHAYSVTLPVANDFPALTVVHMVIDALDADAAYAEALSHAHRAGYTMDFRRDPTVELD
jgi:hypothetical protein